MSGGPSLMGAAIDPASITPADASAATRKVTNVLIVGVGGQGVIMVSKALAWLAQSRGLDVKQSEVHGMAKRGGSVFSHVRFGPRVWSPIIPEGEADILVALEWAEAMRWLPHLKRGTGMLLCDTKRIVPPFACLNRQAGAPLRYSRETPEEVKAHVPEGYAMDATGMAEGLGNERASNVVLLGALSAALDFQSDEWEQAIAQFVPKKTIAVNLEAFRAGRAWIEEARVATPVPAQAPETAEGAALAPAPAHRKARLEITAQWCKSCDICVKFCPERCLRLNSERVAELTDPNKCTGCRVCEWLCPDFAIRVHLDNPAVEGSTA
ncbi:MAG TPA: 2-oxoacid:acceptor oxidoreductase family protein [Ramlibacter sp.]|nr:2-oxoacid:acceptor oxidoreductase family protein [Ramlibacter sp.]